MGTLYTALHQNILDVFNEYGVQIMTPAYEEYGTAQGGPEGAVVFGPRAHPWDRRQQLTVFTSPRPFPAWWQEMWVKFTQRDREKRGVSLSGQEDEWRNTEEYQAFFTQFKERLSQDFESALLWRQLSSFRWLNSALAARGPGAAVPGGRGGAPGQSHPIPCGLGVRPPTAGHRRGQGRGADSARDCGAHGEPAGAVRGPVTCPGTRG